MFENLLFQPVSQQLQEDIINNTLPNALLFSGPDFSGKLTAALELARIVSCSEKALWTCTCPSCLKHKALVSTSLLLAGSKNCSLEIAAAGKAFLSAYATNASNIRAVRYLFLRSVRKLTLRFNPILWEGEDKVSKIAPLVATIDEYLEELESDKEIEIKELEKICKEVYTATAKLENFMYESVPVAQIRRINAWARYRTDSGKKVVILENADKMQEAGRNALLKILEEPPEDVIFVLTTKRRNAVMPTILSRVRTYHFVERKREEEAVVIQRVFHGSIPPGSENQASIRAYLESFLPIDSQIIESTGRDFVFTLLAGKRVNLETLLETCGGFEPILLLTVFFKGIMLGLKEIREEPNLTKDAPFYLIRVEEMRIQCLNKIRECQDRIRIYNQNIMSALELFTADIDIIIKKFRGGVIL